MAFKKHIIKPFALRTSRLVKRNAQNALEDQEQIFRELITKFRQTALAREQGLEGIEHYDSYRQRVPVRDYEAFRPYLDRIIEGEKNVLWPGRPKYFAKTSGTTSGVKYIPLTRESIPNHFGTARNTLVHYAASRNRFDIFDGKMIFLSGSPELEEKGGIPTGRLSGIVNHFVPSWLRSNQLPSYETNCIEDWDQKLEQVILETSQQDMRLISGIPPWVQMYYERLLEYTGKSTVAEIFQNYKVFVYGGVNYEPYSKTLEKLVGPKIDTIETYPASEGFVAFQDTFPHSGLLLNTRSGIFFEFIPADEIFDANPTRLKLSEIDVGINYAIAITSNAGLWAYNLGDTVEFISINPYRLRVSGRISHFISAFGEHVIAKEVERAMMEVISRIGCRVIEFTVAPQVNPKDGGAPFHEWFIEFENPPQSIEKVGKMLDETLQSYNIYYKDLRDGNILRSANVRSLRKGTFHDVMKADGKLGGQNKVPRLSNDRMLADKIENIT